MSKKRESKEILQQIIAVILVLLTASYSGYAFYQITILQEEEQLHEQAIKILNELHERFHRLKHLL